MLCLSVTEMQSCTSLRAAGGIENLVSLLKALNAATASDAARSLRSTLLSVLLALAVDEPNRVVAYSAGVVPVLVQLLGTNGDPVSIPGPNLDSGNT